MRFRTNSSPPPHLDRKLQRRMLGYVALIAVGMFVFQILFAEKRRPDVVQNVPPAAPGDRPFQVREEPIPLDADEFRMPLSQSSLDEADGQSPDLPNSSDGYVIDPFYLRAVKDNTLNVRREESDAFFYVLDRARQLPLEAFEKAAPENIQYLNLMHEPTRYRGHPLTIVGDLWRLYEFPASENPYGLSTLYEAWILTADSGNRPYRIVCSHLGPELSVDMPKPVPVKVTGFFFKREGYHSVGGLHVAPTILAGSLQRYVSTYAPPEADGLVPVVMGVVVAVGLILATTLISFAWNDRSTPRRVQKLPAMSSHTAEELSAIDYRSVRDQLRDLEDKHRIAEWTHGRFSQPEAEPVRESPTADFHQNGHGHYPETAPELPTPLPPTRPPRSSRYDESLGE